MHIIYRYLVFKDVCKTVTTGLSLILKNETIWYYDYTHKDIIVLDGLSYIRQTRVDMGEVSYLTVKKNGKKVTVRAERF